MDRVRAALYLDFDNVFSGLLKLDPDAAIGFAQSPDVWLTRLSTSLTVDGSRRWLVLRCYMNPAGWVPHPHPAGDLTRLYFSKFRPFFTGAGFEVIDCPRLTHTKNGADIRIVVDAVDALSSGHYEEFVVASGDSDMTALLVRLRAADRRTTIVSPSDAAAAFTAVADRLVTGQQVLELVQDEQVEDEGRDLAEGYDVPAEDVTATDAGNRAGIATGASFARFRSLVFDRYTAASAPLNLATLAHEVRRELGAVVDESRWFGFGSFIRALDALQLPGIRRSQHRLWDGTRHEPPASGGSNTHGFVLPEPVARLTALMNLPRLPDKTWPRIYAVFADYAASHDFSLTEATRWSRDRLVEQGVEVSRAAVGFVANGVAYGGCPLYRTPPPTADELAAAFVANVLARAEAAELVLTSEDTQAVSNWLGVPTEQPS